MNSNLSYSAETAKLGCDLCDLDLWPWPFAWTLPWSVVITPKNFMMMRWWKHSQKGMTDRQTDRQTDRRTENTIHRAAWSQLKSMFMIQFSLLFILRLCQFHMTYFHMMYQRVFHTACKLWKIQTGFQIVELYTPMGSGLKIKQQKFYYTVVKNTCSIA